MAASPSCLQRSCGDQASMLGNSSGASQEAPSVTPSMTITVPVASTKELVSSDESITTALSNESPIDSALISALADPRERVALLRCEQHFVTFLQSPDVTEILVGGSYNSVIHGLSQNQQQPTNAVAMPGVTWNNQGMSNTFPTINSRPTSFQRCWLHRLADRFGIVREPVNTEWIKCQKTSQSAMPAQLLCNHVEEKTPKGKRPNKMKIMKRNSSSSSSSLTRKNKDDNETRKAKDKLATSSSAGSLKRTSLSDKEKAYAEARARIFQLDEADVGVSSSAPASSNFTATVATTSPPTLSNSPVLEISSEDPPITTTPHNWISGISKVTWRNRQEEENDPDFQRGILYSPQDMAYYYQTQAQVQPSKDQQLQLQQQQQQQYQLPHQYQGTPTMYYYNPSFSNDAYRSTPSSGSAPSQPGGYPTSSS